MNKKNARSVRKVDWERRRVNYGDGGFDNEYSIQLDTHSTNFFGTPFAASKLLCGSKRKPALMSGQDSQTGQSAHRLPHKFQSVQYEVSDAPRMPEVSARRNQTRRRSPLDCVPPKNTMTKTSVARTSNVRAIQPRLLLADRPEPSVDPIRRISFKHNKRKRNACLEVKRE